MQVISGIVFTLLFLALLAVGFVYTGAYDVTAVSEHTKPVEWLLHKARHQAIERNTYSMRDRDFAGDQTAMRRGAVAYDEMCAGCHGAPGQSPFAGARNMYPAPPGLSRLAGYHSAKEIFYVTKFGLKMTGMPAWGSVTEDKKIWDIAAFVTQARGLDESAYQAMLGNPAAATAGQAPTDEKPQAEAEMEAGG